MNLSLNEVEALAKKATRGAGYPWGLAEEAAKATRWLCERDVDGCSELAGLLEQSDGSDLSHWSPVDEGTTWVPRGKKLCPIITGAALSDRANDLRSAELRIKRVEHPLLLAPFAGWSARHLETTVALAWDETVVCTDGHDLSIEGSASDGSGDVTVLTGGDMARPNQRRTRSEPRSGDFDALNRFAQKTYAPATEESRLKGAGAGLSDND